MNVCISSDTTWTKFCQKNHVMIWSLYIFQCQWDILKRFRITNSLFSFLEKDLPISGNFSNSNLYLGWQGSSLKMQTLRRTIHLTTTYLRFFNLHSVFYAKYARLLLTVPLPTTTHHHPPPPATTQKIPTTTHHHPK